MMQEEETDIEDIILNLKIISKIRQHEKLLVVNKTLTVDHRIGQPFWRWYTADNRTDALQFITSVVNSALDYTQQTNHIVYDAATLKTELMNVIQGLDNLSATYKLDNFIVAKIDILRDKINKICA
jgi:hypothetical protein